MHTITSNICARLSLSNNSIGDAPLGNSQVADSCVDAEETLAGELLPGGVEEEGKSLDSLVCLMKQHLENIALEVPHFCMSKGKGTYVPK